jgi:hypothetical protein
MALFGMECGFSQSQLRARRHKNGGLTPGSLSASMENGPLRTDFGASNNHHFLTRIIIKISGFGPDLGAA